MFGPSPVFSIGPLRAVAARSFNEWLYLLAGTLTCAIFWCLAHLGRGKRRRLFVPFALFVPLLFGLIAAAGYALKYDPTSRAAFEMVEASIRHSPDWKLLPLAIKLFLSRVLRLAVLLPQEAAVQSRILDYVWLAIGTQAAASTIGIYARFRRAATPRELFAALRGDLGVAARAPVVVAGSLTGIADRGPLTAGQTVARAIAWPWLIPAAAAAWFVISNGLFNLFPLVLGIVPLVAYGIALGLWSIAEDFEITNWRYGGALVGLLAAIAAVVLCSGLGAQAWMLRFQVGGQAKLGLLTSYLPVYIATIISIERGVRIGWRNAGRKADAPAGA